MPSRIQHLNAVRCRLGRLMGVDATHATPMLALGLQQEALAALCFVRHPCEAGVAGRPILGFDERIVPARLPTWLRSPLDDEPVPVLALRIDGPARAQTWIGARNDTSPLFEGALSAILRLDADPTRLLALTAGHVCGASRITQRGDRLSFTSVGAGPSMSFGGDLLDWQPNFVRLDGATPLDAGIAEVRSGDLARLASQPRHWPAGVAQARVTEALRLRTRDLEISGRGFDWIDVTLSVAGDPSRRYTLRNAMAWQPSLPSRDGDSGAPLWNDADQIVALHAGGHSVQGEGSWAYAVPISRVLAWVGASVVCRGEALRPASPAMPSPATVPSTPVDPDDRRAREARTLARTMYGEARGEGSRGLEAVAHVVLNRVDARRWWGTDVIGVCLKPWQFSCWNAADPNRSKLHALSAEDPVYARAFEAAVRLLELQDRDHGRRLRTDPTEGATHYYAPALVKRPAWAEGRTPCARIGRHDFFRDVA
ncbi:MAG: cell wall hydrolase [Burkholderiaceae bacterium]